MADKLSFMEAVTNRRSIYTLNNKTPISDDRIEELVLFARDQVPSAFDSQSTRMCVLLNEEHERFWEFVKDILRVHMGEEKFPKTETKLNGFKAAKGTVGNQFTCLIRF